MRKGPGCRSEPGPPASCWGQGSCFTLAGRSEAQSRSVHRVPGCAVLTCVRGPLATLTFTHGRPDDTGSPKDGAMELKSVVRARIVLTGNNLVALRDLLIRAIKEQGGDERRH